jgi:hypothetical protein
MSGFSGFRREHFDYFLIHDDDDARRWLIEQARDLAGQLRDKLRPIAPFYEEYDVGKLHKGDAHCWVAFGPGKQKYRQMTHQTVSFWSDGLRVFVNAELKPATDRVKDVVARHASAFRKALLNLYAFEPFELILEERVKRQGRPANSTTFRSCRCIRRCWPRRAPVTWRGRHSPRPFAGSDCSSYASSAS